jgi:hypothetical protein
MVSRTVSRGRYQLFIIKNFLYRFSLSRVLGSKEFSPL